MDVSGHPLRVPQLRRRRACQQVREAGERSCKALKAKGEGSDKRRADGGEEKEQEGGAIAVKAKGEHSDKDDEGAAIAAKVACLLAAPSGSVAASLGPDLGGTFQSYCRDSCAYVPARRGLKLPCRPLCHWRARVPRLSHHADWRVLASPSLVAQVDSDRRRRARARAASRARAVGQAAPVDPHHHRPQSQRRRRLRPHHRRRLGLPAHEG